VKSLENVCYQSSNIKKKQRISRFMVTKKKNASFYIRQNNILTQSVFYHQTNTILKAVRYVLFKSKLRVHFGSSKIYIILALRRSLIVIIIILFA